MGIEKKQIGARIRVELYRRLKVLAAEEDVSVGCLLETAILDLLQKREGERREPQTTAKSAPSPH